MPVAPYMLSSIIQAEDLNSNIVTVKNESQMVEDYKELNQKCDIVLEKIAKRRKKKQPST